MNSIGKIVFDLISENEESPRHLYGRWDAHWIPLLEREADEVLQKYDLSSRVIQVDMLTLETGTLPEEEFDALFLPLFRQHLEETLRDYLQGSFYQREAGVSLSGNLLDILCRFLLHGTLPWSTESRYRSFSALFLAVLSGYAAELKQFLFTYGHYSALQQRLVWHLEDPQLERGVRLLASAESLFICSYIRLLQVKYKELQRPLMREDDYRNSLWQIVYAYLLHHRDSFFNRKHFVSSTIHRMAGHYNLTYRDLVLVFTSRLYSLSLRYTIPSPLYLLLFQLREEVEEQEWEQVWSHPALFLDRMYRRQEGEEITEEIRQQLVRLRRLLSRQESCRRFLLPLREEEILRIVSLFLPAEVPFVEEYTRELTRQKEEGILRGKAGGEFRMVKWQILFPLLLEKEGGAFNRKYIVEKVLREVAAHYNLAYRTLLTYVCVWFSSHKRSGGLVSIFLQLQQELFFHYPDKEGGQQVLSVEIFIEKIRRKEIGYDDEPDELFKILSQSSGRYRMIRQLSEKEHYFLISALFPLSKDTIYAYVKGLNRQTVNGVLQGKAGREFRTLKWHFIYQVLTRRDSRSFNEVWFVEKRFQG
ncbi:MAG: hypothetical protein LUE93_15165 [Bacteroides sp.]|nr:hypothetical protein [Bacteroides sp.]